MLTKTATRLLVTLFLLAASNLGQQTTADDIVGQYSFSTGFHYESYILKSDSTYKFFWGSDCCNEGEGATGTYTFVNGLVHFKPEKITKGWPEVTSTRDAGKDDTAFDMNLIRWGDRRYLVLTKNLPKFAAAVNLGVEPRPALINPHHLATFSYVRTDPRPGKVTGLPELPAEAASLITSKAIVLRITKIEKTANSKIVVVAKTKRIAQIPVAMAFLGTKKRNDAGNILWVISSDGGVVRLSGNDWAEYRIGEMITTKAKFIWQSQYIRPRPWNRLLTP